MWQLQRKLFSRRNKAHNHLQLWIPRRQRHPSLWNSRVASLVTRFTVIWSASPQATMVFWREIINWERHRITATSEHFLGGFCSLPEKKKLRLRRSSRMQNDHFFFGFKRITFFLGSKWHQRVGFWETDHKTPGNISVEFNNAFCHKFHPSRGRLCFVFFSNPSWAQLHWEKGLFRWRIF